MKNKTLTKTCVALVGSLAVLITTAEAKPGKGEEKSKDKGGASGHSQKGKSDKVDKGPDHKADSAHSSKGKSSDDKGGKDLDLSKIERFRDDDRESIVKYFSGYRDNEGGLPPGLAKNLRRGKPLPPGWQKKVEPGYRIDDESWPEFSPLSYDLFPNLRPVPNTRLYQYGDRVVRVYEPRREVMDVIVVPTLRP